jgi:hypothetical protein
MLLNTKTMEDYKQKFIAIFDDTFAVVLDIGIPLVIFVLFSYYIQLKIGFVVAITAWLITTVVLIKTDFANREQDTVQSKEEKVIKEKLPTKNLFKALNL